MTRRLHDPRQDPRAERLITEDVEPERVYALVNNPLPTLTRWLRRADRAEFERWVRASRVRASGVRASGMRASGVRRARIALLAADGQANSRIAQVVGVSVPDGAAVAGPLPEPRRVQWRVRRSSAAVAEEALSAA